ncbi:MAG TPA: MBL fold metallo-hydrolase [Bacilli bacterium]|nr:MBL fold metallo-hydrolase [Bacilli bacterium]
MRICVLASGSEGNVTYIETKHHRILLDLGKQPQFIKNRLDTINVAINEIDAIIISHTHTDHVSGLEKFIKKYPVAVYVTVDMMPDLSFLNDYNKLIIYDEKIVFSDLIITSIKASHDVIDARNFIINYQKYQIGYITDTGYISRKHFDLLRNLDIYLFESNHDITMLMQGPYPEWLKQRVLGTVGHLSNRDAAIYLAKLIGPSTKKIVLIHLSKKNNDPQVALATIQEVFQIYNKKFSNIICAEQNQSTPVIILK